jgi:hypothetical protein
MAEALDQPQHEFWRAPMPASGNVASRERSATCRCGTEFIVSSLYCHACGAGRPDLNPARTLEIPGVAELVSIGERLGLTTPAVIAFLLGVLCVVGSVAVRVLFSVRTVLECQAIQFLQIEWPFQGAIRTPVRVSPTAAGSTWLSRIPAVPGLWVADVLSQHSWRRFLSIT